MKILNKLLESILIVLLLASVIGALVYRLYSLNYIGVIITLILVVILFLIIQLSKKKSNNSPTFDYSTSKDEKTSKYPYIISVAYIITWLASLFVLYSSQTSEPIISPWEVVPGYFFILYFTCTFLIFINIIFKQKLSLLLVSLHYFLSFSVAILVYEILYGFDSFVHLATLELIDKQGTVDPKPFYYLSQYGLIIILHKISNISIFVLNKILVGVLAAIYLPTFLYYFLNRWFNDKQNSLFVIIGILTATFPFLIMTTPQNLSYLFLIFAILVGLNCKNYHQLALLYLLAFAALLAQPIAGIPALLFALAITIYNSELTNKKIIYAALSIAAIVALPLAFFIFESNHSSSQTNLEILAETSGTNQIHFPHQENFMLNSAYFYEFNLSIVIAFIILGGVLIALKKRKNCKIFFLNLVLALSFAISYFLLKNLEFKFLINYERSNYTDRLITVALIFCLPFILTALFWFMDKIKKQEKITQIIFLVFLSFAITAGLYFSYPRHDRYHNSRGYSTAQNDIEAVEWINNNTQNDYIVLANQQVSAAALYEYGFSKYYDMKNGKSIFYYPIPTGEELYQYYLKMVYEKPSRDTVLAAMDLAGVEESYFVLNKYWWAFPKILSEAKTEANEWQALDEGNIYIFKYLK